MKAFRSCLSAVVLIGMLGCEDDDNLGSHDCEVAPGFLPDPIDLELRHTEPRTCPVFVHGPLPAAIQQTGGTFVETSAPPSQLSSMSLVVTNSPQGEVKALINRDFDWINNGIEDEWAVSLSVYFEPLTGTYMEDKANFVPIYHGGYSAPAWQMTITYVIL
jgi:hypothetical protein